MSHSTFPNPTNTKISSSLTFLLETENGLQGSITAVIIKWNIRRFRSNGKSTDRVQVYAGSFSMEEYMRSVLFLLHRVWGQAEKRLEEHAVTPIM